MDLNSQIKSLIPANSSVLVALIPELFKSRYGSPIPLRKRKLTDFLKDANAGFEVFVINNALAVKVGSKGINKTSLLSVKAQPKVKNIGKANEATITNNVKGVKSNVKKPALQCELTRRGNPKLAKASGFGDITKSFSEMKISEREVSNMQLADLVEAENIHTAMVTKLSSFVFAPSYRSDDSAVRGRSLFTNNGNNNSGCGYLGNVESAVGTPDFYDDGYGDGDDYFGIDDATDTTAAAEDSHFYINTSEPFCTVCIGVQGAGKSHTMNVLLENCMLQSVQGDDERAIISTRQPMSGLVLHFDQSQSNVCEAVGLKSSAAELSLFPHLRVQELVILVSPSFYKQRKEFYGAEYRVVPLLFDWASLSALQLRKLMRLTDTDSQLYVSTMLNLLRDYQRDNKIPVFSDFVDNVKLLCNVSGQSAPLTQRLELLQNFVRDSSKNAELKEFGVNFSSLLESGTLVVADLTDPMLSPDEACGVFQVLLEQFRGHNLGSVGKVVTFDEAHKYLNNSGPGCVELSNAIVDTVRLMRHEGMRVLISTQSPLTMPPELLELSSATILHRFQSADWCKYLQSKVTLPSSGFERIKRLQQGQALLLSTHMDLPGQPRDQVVLNVRRRLTQDLGASRRNKVKEGDSSENV